MASKKPPFAQRGGAFWVMMWTQPGLGSRSFLFSLSLFQFLIYLSYYYYY